MSIFIGLLMIWEWFGGPYYQGAENDSQDAQVRATSEVRACIQREVQAP